MRIYLFLLVLVGCVGTEQDFRTLYRSSCGEELKTNAPITCNGKPFLPMVLESKEELVTLNLDVMASFISLYTPGQLNVRAENGDALWTLALKAGAEKLYLYLISVPGQEVNRAEASRVFYNHAPTMFRKYQNYLSLQIDPSMELYLQGNGQNPHSVYPLSSSSKDVILKYLYQAESLSQIAHLFYFTNALKDPDFIKELEPYLHLSLPFPSKPELTVSLGALVARKWSYQLRAEFFVENDAVLDPLALAVYEGAEIAAYLPFTRTSNAMAVAYSLLDDSQYNKLGRFPMKKLNLLKPHPLFKAIVRNSSDPVRETLGRSLDAETNSYSRLRSMILAIQAGHHDARIVNYFWYKLNHFVKVHGTYPSFNRFIGHELKPILDILTSYGHDLNQLVPKFHKHLKQKDALGMGSL